MKKLALFIAFLYISSIVLQAQTCPAVSLAFEPSTSASVGKLSPHDLATDDYGNIYIAGSIDGGVVQFNNNVPPLTDWNTRGFFVAKYDKFGNAQWAVSMGNSNAADYLTGIAVSPDGSQIYVTGRYQNTAVFGSHSITSVFNNAGTTRTYDVFVAKLTDNGGTRTWQWAVSGGGKGEDNSRGIAIDNFGKVYIGGNLDSKVAGNEGVAFGSITFANLYGDDSFVARLTDNNTSATWDWIQKASANVAATTLTTYDDDIFAITCNKTNGDVFVTGVYYQDGGAAAHTFSFGGLSIPKTNSNDNEAFVLKLNTNGNGQWITKAGGTAIGNQEGRGIAVDSVGNVFVMGDFRNTTNFGLNTNEIPSLTSTGISDVFIGKINANGTWAWAKKMGGDNIDTGGGIDYHNGQVWGVGVFRGTATFKTINQLTALGSDPNSNAYPYDVFLVNLDKNGNWLGEGATQMGGEGQDRMYLSNNGYSMGLSIDSNNVPCLAGLYTGTAAVFGNTTLTRSGENPFVVRVNCAETPPICTQSLSAYMPAFISPTENTNNNFLIHSMLKDGSNNTFLAGRITGAVTFGLATGGTQSYLPANGSAIVAAFNSANKALWVIQMGSANAEILDIDFSSGGIAFVGNMIGIGNFTKFAFATGTAISTASLSSTNGSQDIIYGEITTRNGITALNFYYNVNGDNYESGVAISFNPNTNHFAITGYVGQSNTAINFRSINMSPPNGITLFTAIYEKQTVSLFGFSYVQASCTALGFPTQNAGYSTVAESYGTDVVIDASNTAYVTGFYQYNNFAQPAMSVKFGSTTLLPSNGNDMLVAKMDVSGNWLWATKAGNEQNIGTPHSNISVSISLGETGYIYLTGSIQSNDPIKFGNSNVSEITPLSSTQQFDVMVAKMNTSGQWIWASRSTGASQQFGGAVLFKNNRVHLVGTMEGTTSFGGLNLNSAGSKDFFFAELTPLGQWLPEKIKKGGGINDDNGYFLLNLPMTVDANNSVYSAGYFVGSTTFGNSNLSNTIAPPTANSAMIVSSFCATCTANPIVLTNPTHNIPSANPEQKTLSNITATNFVTAGSVLYQAGTYVQFEPGFKVDAVTVFKAQIGGCN
jgi:hypothetical protein